MPEDRRLVLFRVARTLVRVGSRFGTSFSSGVVLATDSFLAALQTHVAQCKEQADGRPPVLILGS